MRKIPTLFVRDEQDRRYVTEQVTPGCEWVLAGEGVGTRKYDGTCVMFDGARWWARREVKPGKPKPANYEEEQFDAVTGKSVGWEPVEQSAFARWHAEALDGTDGWAWGVGTYELCGPKINGDPERLGEHTLIRHDDAERVRPFSLTFDGIRETCLALRPFEGIVWHHPDGRRAKIKARDFRERTDRATRPARTCPTCHGRGVLPPTLVCANDRCGKDFQPEAGPNKRHRSRMYCSLRCKNAVMQRRSRERRA